MATKRDLIKTMASSSGLTQKQSAKALDAAIAGIREIVHNGDEITLRDFAVFGIVERGATRYKDPRTAELIEVPARSLVRIKVSRNF